MSLLRRPALRATRPRETPRRASYVTDGSRLFRVIAPLNPDLGLHSAVLEDCRTLAWASYEATELWWLRLRAVTPGDPVGDR